MIKTYLHAAKLISSRRPRIPLRIIGIMLIFLLTAGISITGSSVAGDFSDENGRHVQIIVDGREFGLLTSGALVADALGEAGLILGALDRVEPSLETALAEVRRIRVTRVEAIISKDIVADPPQTVVLANPDLRPGLNLLVQKGEPGKIRREVRIWKKNGLETAREVIKTTVLKPRVDAIEMRYSTELASRGGAVRACKIMQASAYDPGPISCGRFADGYTAIGMKAEKGVVAVDPRVIPMRTRLYVEGYGFAIAADTGGAIKGNRIDLCFPTYREAINYGRRTVKVYILD